MSLPSWFKRFCSPSAFSLLVLAGALLAILGAKWSLIHRYGSDVPYMDQWDAEARLILLPEAEGKLILSSFFEPHNEHRPVLTKLTNYALTKLDGQWSPLLEMSFNALIHLGAIGTMLLFAWRQLRPLPFALLSAFAVLLFSIPYAWENTLQGFQSQFYFLSLTAVTAIWLLLGSTLFHWRWWLGFCLAVVGLGSMSSGLTAAVAAGAMLCFKSLIERRWSGRMTLALAILVAVSLAGLLLTTRVVGHDFLRAATLLEALRAFLACLSWPGAPVLAWAALVPLPFVLLSLLCLQRRELSRTQTIVLGWNIWCWLQMLALAIARGHDLPTGSPRYCDLFAFAVLGNALALGLNWPGIWNKVRIALALPWLVFVVSSLLIQRGDHEGMLRTQFTETRMAEKIMFSQYLQKHDPMAIKLASSISQPHPNLDMMIGIMEHPKLKRLMPPSLRDPVSITPEKQSHGFIRVEAPIMEPYPPVKQWVCEKGPAQFRSTPLTAKLPFLRLHFKGDKSLRPDCVYLETDDGKRSTLEIRSFAGDRWQRAHLLIPSLTKPVRLVVHLDSASQSLAFAEPVELGSCSWLAHHAAKHGATLRTCGIALAGLGLLGLFLLRLSASCIWRRVPSPGQC